MKSPARNHNTSPNVIPRASSLLWVLVLVFCSLAHRAHAQVARVAAAQRVIETKAGEAGPWRKTGSGAKLGVDDRLRTGKRSKADLKFSDGSLLRLGQLSSVAIRGPKNVALTGGKLLFSAIRPGTRIVAGAAAAEIKGSSGIISLQGDGVAEFLLFNGAMDVVNELGQRVSLLPGQLVTVNVAGIISPPRVAPPFSYSASPLRAELSTPPQAGPFVGSDADIIIRNVPDRLINEPAAEALLVSEPGVARGNPLAPVPGRSGGAPFPIPFPTLPGVGGGGPPPIGGGGPGARIELASTARAFRSSLPRINHAGRTLQAKMVVPLIAAKARVKELPLNLEVDGPAITPVALQVPPAAPSTGEVTQAGDIADDLATLDNSDLREASRHLDEAYAAGGEISGGDAHVLGAIGDAGLRAYGGRLHAFSANGPWHVDLAAQSIRVRAGDPTIPDLDLTAISSATLTYRNRLGDIQLGRQRFQEGPTQATLFGSLVRQGTREIMDAARIRPNIGKKNRLELAYLFDAYPRNLPYRIGGRQRGLYGRFATQGNLGRFGVNVLKYNNIGIPNTTGATFDFAIPVIRNQVELYGEVGRDTFRRRLTAAGLSFPGLYDRTDFDVFVEYANLRSSNIALRPPTELTLRVYRRINDNANIIASASRFYGSGSSFIFGVAFGARTTTHPNFLY